jgi:hypothetical protein
MVLILSFLVVLTIVLLWLMIYRYTEYYRTLKNEIRQVRVDNGTGKSVNWGETPKHKKTGKWPPVPPSMNSGKSANEPRLLLGGLTYREAQKATQKEQCVVMEQLGIDSVETYQRWYEENKDDDEFDKILRVVSGCVQEGMFCKGDGCSVNDSVREAQPSSSKSKKLEDLIRF